MGRYAKNYAYEWADNLIYFCSDPFNRFPDQRRQIVLVWSSLRWTNMTLSQEKGFWIWMNQQEKSL